MPTAVSLEVLEGVHSPELGNQRDVLVYVPSSYHRSDRSYPVLYMQDGQNLFDSGASYAFEAEYLRVMSPSAEVQGHSAEERKTVPGKRQVAILEVQPIGNYAVRLVFDDMHSTGIFSWAYLRELGRDHTKLWQEYLDELAAKNMSRSPTRR